MIKKFEIENINDYVHVQKQVLSTLNAENFFDDEGGKSKTVINKDSGMVIVINKKGIKETFNNKNYFNYSRNLKLAKLASIRKIPELIENGKLILDDEKNYHRNNSSAPCISPNMIERGSVIFSVFVFLCLLTTGRKSTVVFDIRT